MAAYITMHSVEFGKEEFTRESWYLYIKKDNKQVRTLHNTTGPAVHDCDGYMEWHLEGKIYPTRSKWEEAVRAYEAK